MFVTWVSEVLTSGGEDIEALLGAERQTKHSSRVLSLGARSLQTDIQNSWSVMLSDLSYWPPCWPELASLNCTLFCRKLNSLSGRGQPQSYKSLLMDQLEKREVRKLRTPILFWTRSQIFRSCNKINGVDKVLLKGPALHVCHMVMAQTLHAKCLDSIERSIEWDKKLTKSFIRGLGEESFLFYYLQRLKVQQYCWAHFRTLEWKVGS